MTGRCVGAVVCWAMLAAPACQGDSGSASPASGRGGDPGASSGGRAGEGGTAGLAASGGTAAGATGAGASPTTGGAASGGGPASGEGGSGDPEAGDGGEAGAGGAGEGGGKGSPSCEGAEPYVDCRCECCDTREAFVTCYYPELGETPETVAAEHPPPPPEACPVTMCDTDTEYHCCASDLPEIEIPGGEYSVGTYIGGIDRVSVEVSNPETCAVLTLCGCGDNPNPTYPHVVTPADWSIEALRAGGCNESAAPLVAIGAVGETAFRRMGDGTCAVDVAVDLYVEGGGGVIRRVRLDAESLPVPLDYACGP